MRKPAYYLPFLGWTVVILTACFINPNQLPNLSFEFIFGPDKLFHFGLFGIQSLTLIWAFYHNKVKQIWLAPLLCSLMGIGVEFVQGFLLIYRSFDYADMLANTIGAFGFWGIWAMRMRF